MYERHKPALQAIVKSIYDHTQAELEKAGVKEITLYRGVMATNNQIASHDFSREASDMALHLRALSKVPNAKVFENGVWDKYEFQATVFDADLDLNPASSFAMDVGTATQFSSAVHDSQIGAVFATVVPRERILSTFATGPGCLVESEMLVIGNGKLKAKGFIGPIHRLAENGTNHDLLTAIDDSEETAGKLAAVGA
jgi:hypothetical protein